MCVVQEPEEQYKVMLQEVELCKNSHQDKLGLMVATAQMMRRTWASPLERLMEWMSRTKRRQWPS